MTRSLKTLSVLSATAAATLMLATTALAAFGGNARPTTLAAFGGHARATSGAWGISLGASFWSGSLTALYPGATGDSELVPFTVTSEWSGNRAVRSITASLRVEPNGDVETARGADISGCLASWFTISFANGERPVPATLAPGASYTGEFELKMRDSGTTQNQCAGTAPAVTVTAA
jgi:hypothetical protein